MYIHQCPECGKQYSTQERVSRVKCPYCGAETNVSYSEQEQTRWQQFNNQTVNSLDSVFNNGPSGKSRGIAGLLAILMGWCGLHYFYIGKTSAGVLFFTSTQEEFEQKWVNSPSNFPLF